MSSELKTLKGKTNNQNNRKFRIQAKNSFEQQQSRQVTMDDTTASFFDNNKLYIKSVQQEAL